MSLLKVVRTQNGWCVSVGKWVIEAATVERAQEKARELCPGAIFVVYFYGPYTRRLRRIRPEVT